MADRLKRLEELVDTLRGPDGCPWDREQTLADLRGYLLEEAHELAAAIDEQDTAAIREETGDLLFHIVFISTLVDAQTAEVPPARNTTLTEVIDGIVDKMVDRHPHVFGDETAQDSAAVHRAWEQRKARQGVGSVLAGVPVTLPALLGAYRISQKASGVGFDWPDVAGVLAKLEEELGEVVSAIANSSGQDAVEEEVGDLLFAAANLARKLKVDPEAALQKANRKFSKRFRAMEQNLEDTARIADHSPQAMEEMWRRAKAEE